MSGIAIDLRPRANQNGEARTLLMQRRASEQPSEATAKMPADQIGPCLHYVYALLREDRQTPFYIGMGKGNRWTHHERKKGCKGSPYKFHIIKQMKARGFHEIPKVKLAEFLSEAAAARLERDIIQLIGRYPRGPLTNLTSGGDGMFDLPLESRERQMAAAKNKSPSHREKLRASAIAAWSDPSIRVRQVAASAAAVKRQEVRDKISANHPSKKRNAHQREIFRLSLVSAWGDPAKREARIAKGRKTRESRRHMTLPPKL